MSIWILGSGRFGVKAACRLAKKHDPAGITLVDPSAEALDRADVPGLVKIQEEGVSFLAAHLYPGTSPDWIVPALPVHLAWEWAVRRLGADRLERMALPRELLSGLPNAMAGETGDLYVSHADFLCPANCSEPDAFCTHTGKPRKEDMFRLLDRRGCPDLPALVIQSRQLGPGLGGYRPKTLFQFLDRLEQIQGPCFTATACRCHGVVTGGIRKD